MISPEKCKKREPLSALLVGRGWKLLIQSWQIGAEFGGDQGEIEASCGSFGVILRRASPLSRAEIGR